MTCSLQPGDEAQPVQFGPITTAHLVRYQGASGAFHPVHFDLTFAQEHGYPNVLSLGMLHAGLLSSLVTDWLGARNVRRFKVRFQDPIFAGDTLTCRARVLRKFESDTAWWLEVEMSCVAQDGRVAATGTATFVVPEAPAAA